jgi:putative salt-induced outer membrane protein YdiY
MNAVARYALAALCVALAAPAYAQAPLPPSAAPPPPLKGPLLHTQIDLGFVSTAGNTSVRTLNLSEQLVVRPGGWAFTQKFTIVNGYTSGVETANNLKAGVRADRTIGAGFRVYALGTFYRNRFAGVARQFEEDVGLAYGILRGPKQVLDVELGSGRNQQTGSDGSSRQYWTSRAAAQYRFNFAAHAYAEQKVELISDLETLDNELLNTETSLAAPVSTHVAVKLGYTVRFVSRPQPTFKQTDTVLSAGLQLQF